MSDSRKRLTITQRREIINELKKSSTQADVARRYNVSKTAVKKIWDKREQYQTMGTDTTHSKCKSLRGLDKNKNVDRPLLEWFYNLRAAEKEVTGNMILSCAKQISDKVGAEVVDESWVQRWRERHGIRYKTIHGEAGDCPDYIGWLVANKSTIESYEKEDIYNADETALFWRMRSGKTFMTASEGAIRGRKKDKASVTLLVAVSMAGKKLPLLCIGTAKTPRWPTVLGRGSQNPIPYASSKKGWMTSEIFDQWVEKLNRDAKMKKKRCLLLVDNCPAHISTAEKYAEDVPFGIRVLLLPKNTTSKLQPCDQGIIRSMKAHYREKLTRVMVHREVNEILLYEGLLMVRGLKYQKTSLPIVGARQTLPLALSYLQTRLMSLI